MRKEYPVNREVSKLVHLFNKYEMEKLIFLSRTKKKLLIFYDLGLEKIGLPLESIKVRTNEWINLLKSFSFFDQTKITNLVERFKKCVAEVNPEIIVIDG